MIDIDADDGLVEIRMSYDTALAFLAHLTDAIESYGTRPNAVNDRIGVRFTAKEAGGIDMTFAYCS